jgi:hypothetical protein
VEYCAEAAAVTPSSSDLAESGRVMILERVDIG